MVGTESVEALARIARGYGRQQPRDAVNKRPAATPTKEEEVPPQGQRALLQSFRAGASGPAMPSDLSSAPSRDASARRALDDMLEQMCAEIDAGDLDPGAAAAPAAMLAPSAAPALPKRPLEATEAARAAKRQQGPGRDAEVAAPGVAVKREQEAPAAFIKQEQEDGAAAAASSPVKVELSSMKLEGAALLVVKQEAGESDLPSSGASQLDWLRASEDVKMEDSEIAVAPAAGVKYQLAPEQDGGAWFFLIDAFEDDRSSPPRVYLFGKVLAVPSSPSSGPSSYQTCCLVVEKMERCIHLLLNVDPTDEDAAAVAAQEAEAEFDSLCRQQCPGLKKLRAKLKFRNYAFEKALPQGSGYLPFLKVLCDASGQMPPAGFSGQTFSHMFGAQTSLLERLVLTRRITGGPSWLRLEPGSWTEDPARLSFCAVELRITAASIAAPKKEDDRRRLTELGMPSSSPPVRVLSLSMQTVQRSAQQPHEPVAVVCTMHPLISPDASESDAEVKAGMRTWAALRRIDSRPLPRDSDQVLAQKHVEHYSSEVALLTALLGKVQEFDPDVIAGYNAYGFDLDVLASRMHGLKIQQWQKLGRLRRPKDRMPRLEGRQAGFWVGSNITAGRLVCDVLLQAKDLLPKLGCYDLPTLAKAQLGVLNLQVMEPEDLPKFYDSAESLVHLAEVTFYNAMCAAGLMHSLQILPLSKQLSSLAGSLWNVSLQNKRAERNEMLLCHEFHRKKFVLPDRESNLMKKRRMQLEGGTVMTGLDEADEAEQGPSGPGPRRGKAAYSGGLVLEPRVGLYEDFVMLLDFNSLYPSIIQEHNICFTTVGRPDENKVSQCGTEAELLAQTRLPDGMIEEGVLPQVLRRLVESRRNVKAAMKSEKDKRRLQMFEIRQKALKLTANSMYGCLGFQNSRFYAKPLAALITAKGRDALQSTINVVQQELQLDVVYGDTDSVFVNTKTQDFKAAMLAAEQIKSSVNKRYKRLEIEIDAVFVRLMLLKKKKYAARKVLDWEKQCFEFELKGLDIVRRDWCGVAKEIGEKVLLRVLSSEGKEETVHWVHDFLTERAREMDELKVPLEKYVITKGLTKDPKDYPDAKNQPHVQVALRLIARGKAVRPGQEVEYVIADSMSEEGAKASLADRARHPHEFQLDPTLRVDIAWYKKQQVHPLVSRLLGPVEGTDTARIAECLGLDGARFAQAAAASKAAGDMEVDSSYLESVGADVSALFDRSARWKDFKSSLPGVKCLKCEALVPWRQLLRPEAPPEGGLLLADALFRCGGCSEPLKPVRAQNLLAVQFRRVLREHSECWVRCDDSYIEKTRRLNRGQNMVSERTVHQELEYMEYLCEQPERLGEDDRQCLPAAEGVHRVTRWLLDCSGHNWVDCGQVFGSIFGERQVRALA